MSKLISSMVAEQTEQGDDTVLFEDDRVNPTDRELGTHLAGALSRGDDQPHAAQVRRPALPGCHPRQRPGRVQRPQRERHRPGRRAGRRRQGRARRQVAILRGLNDRGERVDGSVGKGFGYGAQGGTFLIQGDADSRCGIRLSGADIVIGGEITPAARRRAGLPGGARQHQGLCV